MRRQVFAQWIPQGDIEVGVCDVEDQPLAGAEEVDVKHRRQLGGRQVGRFGEEAAGEHLERQMACGLGKVDVTQERFGVEMVEPTVDFGHRHSGERRRRAGVEPHQVTEPKRGAAQRESKRVKRRCLRQPTKGVASAMRVDQRVVVDRRSTFSEQDRCGAAGRAGCSTAGRTRGIRGSSPPPMPSGNDSAQPPTRPPR